MSDVLGALVAILVGFGAIVVSVAVCLAIGNAGAALAGRREADVIDCALLGGCICAATVLAWLIGSEVIGGLS